MASGHTRMASEQKPAFDENTWVIHIRHNLDEEADEDESAAVSIFSVPKPLLACDPEAYTPQLIALGPYHRWRPELYEMERYKLSAAKRTQKRLLNVKFQHLVELFAKHQLRIRCHYHRFVDCKGETLAWMMIVDASFLLEFLQNYADEEGQPALRRLPSRACHLVDCPGRKTAHNNIILRDVVMLENQIPMFVLRKLMAAQCPSQDSGDVLLTKMLTGFMKELCPFKAMEGFPSIDVTKRSHLLEILYHVLVLVPEEHEHHGIEEENVTGDDGPGGDQPRGDPTYVKQLLDAIWGFASTLNDGPVRYVKEAITSRPVAIVAKVPWKMVTALPGFSVLKGPVENLFSSQGKKGSGAKEEDPSSTQNLNKPPLIEEIMIPSVAELVNAGVRFCPTAGDITTVAFDAKTATFYLPAVTLDVNTEVVLRNLVAYEASAVLGPLVFTRYTELMNGIIDTEEDVRLLRKSGVVVNRMKKDGEVADLWNGMSKSVRLTRVRFMDKAIEEVNRYHSSRCRVRAGKFMKRYVFGSWPFLTFLAAVLLLLLNGLQAFCSAYGCSRWFQVPLPTQRG